MPEKPFKLAVRAVIRDEKGNCLLLRRSGKSDFFPTQWEWPGGKVEKQEDFAEAVIRETAEETGLRVEITGFAGAARHEMPAVNVILLCMEARVVGGEVALSDEHEEFAWVALGALGGLNLTGQARDFMLHYGAAASGSSSVGKSV